jgi:HAD superfamily hydrolase (TIGR01509 family)
MNALLTTWILPSALGAVFAAAWILLLGRLLKKWGWKRDTIQKTAVFAFVNAAFLCIIAPSLPFCALLCAAGVTAYCLAAPVSKKRMLDGLLISAMLPLAAEFYLQYAILSKGIASAGAFLMAAGYFLFKGYICRKCIRSGQPAAFALLWSALCAVLPGVLDPWLLLIFAVFALAAAGVYVWSRKGARKPLLLFDLDGTLIDSRPLVFETFKQVFAKKLPDHKLSEEELYSFFGPPLEKSFGRYFPENEVEDVIDLYQQINLDLHPSMLKTMPHAKELLSKLKEQGYTIGIVSNKRQKPVELGLTLSGLMPYTDIVLGKENLGTPKPDPSGLRNAAEKTGYLYDEIVYIGDTPSDVQAAKNMAVCSIGYTMDKTQKEPLQNSGCSYFCEDLNTIGRIVQEERTWIDNTIW